MTRSGGSYIHGTSPGEQERLSRLNAVMNGACLREIPVGPGDRILDVGSGLGQFTRMLARAAGAPALGIERDPEQLGAAQRLAREAGEERLAEFRPGDALAIPLREGEAGSFDLAHARFILEHVADPERVVAGMAAAVRPGGRVVLADDDHDILRLWPEPPDVMPVWRAYMETYRRAGNDPDIGRKLPALLHGAGLRPVRATWVFFGACAGDEQYSPLLLNMAAILRGAARTIAATGQASETDVERAAGAIEAMVDRPDGALWHAISLAMGVRP